MERKSVLMCMMARPKGKRDFEQIRSAIDEFMAGEKPVDIGERRGASASASRFTVLGGSGLGNEHVHL